MEFRTATKSDAGTLARMNWQLIKDERHRNAMSLPELETRMADWLAGEYSAVLFMEAGKPIGYALFRREPEYVYLRQFFVQSEHRRRGFGRAAIEWLHKHVWAERRVRIDVLIGNATGIAFWRAVGFRDYCLTMELHEVAFESSEWQ